MQRTIKPMFEQQIRSYKVGYRNALGQWLCQVVYAHCPGSALRHARELLGSGAHSFALLPDPTASAPSAGMVRELRYG